ncbi:SDR family NAD(P)-dependent oxidoreductase [Oleiagrimonas sp.]|jgi:3-oxoacyl-[acyl-carrier protein] reductase|uniref:SDR family NAD(P)-dependent oxidoreductase n=1 Tax=Oleiagrimonas sp. TaxID=2010330 RepID=UPI0026247161|nr:SDR family NAD(P)-dependent oxidoreductase [Oleiagrimonas sp.]MDA3912862.1 SDR family NAD(P)-dependent oxidoreductase [Oleiagrimonas sp.]
MKTPFDFSGYRVLVAGGSKGIGRAIALGFAQAGASVSACARGAQALAALDSELEAFGGSTHTHACDLSKPEAIAEWISTAAEALGGIDVLVNNASGYGFDGDDDASWIADFEVDLMAAVRASRLALPHLEQSDHASIVHTSSIAALHPRVSGAPYAALKAALSSFTGSQALQLADRRIRVNAVAPGSIEFPDGLWDQVRKDQPQRYESIRDSIPFGHLGAPEDVARVVLFLASPMAAWITGQTLCVDGGQSLNG